MKRSRRTGSSGAVPKAQIFRATTSPAIGVFAAAGPDLSKPARKNVAPAPRRPSDLRGCFIISSSLYRESAKSDGQAHRSMDADLVLVASPLALATAVAIAPLAGFFADGRDHIGRFFIAGSGHHVFDRSQFGWQLRNQAAMLRAILLAHRRAVRFAANGDGNPLAGIHPLRLRGSAGRQVDG